MEISIRVVASLNVREIVTASRGLSMNAREVGDCSAQVIASA